MLKLNETRRRILELALATAKSSLSQRYHRARRDGYTNWGKQYGRDVLADNLMEELQEVSAMLQELWKIE